MLLLFTPMLHSANLTPLFSYLTSVGNDPFLVISLVCDFNKDIIMLPLIKPKW